jgi:hypothetical protein
VKILYKAFFFWHCKLKMNLTDVGMWKPARGTFFLNPTQSIPLLDYKTAQFLSEKQGRESGWLLLFFLNLLFLVYSERPTAPCSSMEGRETLWVGLQVI